MPNPTVTFIVPCYKLGHLLPECINSILAQSYCDFEIVIMDDCSPDNTPEIAASFRDVRVKYVRNEPNLGHLKNYNKGIRIAAGKYVWLISADDRLRRHYVLERYVRLMEQSPNLGFVCCPGIGLQEGKETGLLDCGYYGKRDKIFGGSEFITTSLQVGHCLLAPSVMVRKDCYEKISDFPLDMPHQGDMYLWFRWALHYDVAYLSEPMVNYRLHDLNIMKDLLTRVPEIVFNDEVNVLWRTRSHCEQEGLSIVAKKCEEALACKYARATASNIYGESYWSSFYWSDCACRLRMDLAQCDEALRKGSSSISDYKRLRAKFFVYLGNQHWRRRTFADAKRSYSLALRENPKLPQIWMKYVFLYAGLGRLGIVVRKLMRDGLPHIGAKVFQLFARAVEQPSMTQPPPK